ncbi:hypothetical protein BJ878DRAFT_481078 [Calycina marina]|uniref:Aminoglycoside phosphotransferase domain-containing protein n=1 Tax=Calycina marina TaxID=1763456 RepID=A0A9P7Z0S7_9HELO|nr:hypothetical protein BJ878DRAFT_481078 [Calycina marina]
MAEQVLARSIDDFFLRCGLSVEDKHECFSLVALWHPGSLIVPATGQGYCSLTLLVGDNKVIQFRPPCYELDLSITEAARDVYGQFAPSTTCIGTIPASDLLVYSMDRVEGLSLRDFRETRDLLPYEYLEKICKDFAVFLSNAWKHHGGIQMPAGTVGRTIIPRLTALSEQLPNRFRPTARRLLKNISQVNALPWVLTHGDITAGNMMIDPSSGRLRGLVDWAEAEVLPFGISIYGLEEIIGDMTPAGFRYQDASALRTVFWNELTAQLPELRQREVLEAVKHARDLGVLLWHGIAFDDGAINRVVEEGRDFEEICRLDAFLD